VHKQSQSEAADKSSTSTVPSRLGNSLSLASNWFSIDLAHNSLNIPAMISQAPDSTSSLLVQVIKPPRLVFAPVNLFLKSLLLVNSSLVNQTRSSQPRNHVMASLMAVVRPIQRQPSFITPPTIPNKKLGQESLTPAKFYPQIRVTLSLHIFNFFFFKKELFYQSFYPSASILVCGKQKIYHRTGKSD